MRPLPFAFASQSALQSAPSPRSPRTRRAQTDTAPPSQHHATATVSVQLERRQVLGADFAVRAVAFLAFAFNASLPTCCFHVLGYSPHLAWSRRGCSGGGRRGRAGSDPPTPTPCAARAHRTAPRTPRGPTLARDRRTPREKEEEEEEGRETGSERSRGKKKEKRKRVRRAGRCGARALRCSAPTLCRGKAVTRMRDNGGVG